MITIFESTLVGIIRKDDPIETGSDAYKIISEKLAEYKAALFDELSDEDTAKFLDELKSDHGITKAEVQNFANDDDDDDDDTDEDDDDGSS